MTQNPNLQLVQPSGFRSMPARIAGEREQRLERAAHLLSYHNAFLTDVLRGILPNDLVVIGAPSGIGKTELALSIGMQNAMNERNVAYFALEAEELELERRTKFAWLSQQAFHRNIDRRGELNFTDWYLGRCEDIVGHLDEEANRWFLSNLCGMRTFYRGQSFAKGDLRREVELIQKHVDLIVIDHLHYIDADEDQGDHDSLGETTKAIRDISLLVGKPVILVAHLRKRDQRLKQIVPSIDDFHGSSNITKIATQVITIAPATDQEAPKWWLAPTYVSVLKDRRAGAPPFVAMAMFDRRTRRYADDYALGRIVKGGTEWEAIKPTETPGWATCHRQLEMNIA